MNNQKVLENLPTYKMIEIENRKIFLIHYPMNKEGEYKEHIKILHLKKIKKYLVRLILIFMYMDILM